MTMHETDFLDETLSAEERLAALSALDRGMAAAFDAVFRHISGYHDILEEEFEEQPGAARYMKACAEVIAAGRRWVHLFQNSLPVEPEFEPLDVQLLISGAVKRCRRLVENQITIDYEAQTDEVLVLGSMFQLQDLFMKSVLAFVGSQQAEYFNLAVKGVRRTLDANFLKLMKSDCREGAYFTITLSTCGCAEFEPGKQIPCIDQLLEAGMKNKHEMDFLHVYGILKEHGGDAFVQKHDDDGMAALTLALPVQGKRKEMQAPHNLDEEALYGTETILLVDDEDMIWDVIIDMLQELGYSVILAANGLEAVEIYRANAEQIDVVLLDMVMPELSGREAFFQLKEIDEHVTVLLSSGYVSEEDARDVLQAGAAGFLQKPYRMVELAKKIRTILDRP